MKPRHLILALICGLLLGYPLSMGPVVRANLAKHHGPYTPVQEKFYAPVFWLASNSPAFGKCLDWYFHLWIPVQSWPDPPYDES
jgi:hypothetical protein